MPVQPKAVNHARGGGGRKEGERGEGGEEKKRMGGGKSNRDNTGNATGWNVLENKPEEWKGRGNLQEQPAQSVRPEWDSRLATSQRNPTSLPLVY